MQPAAPFACPTLQSSRRPPGGCAQRGPPRILLYGGTACVAPTFRRGPLLLALSGSFYAAVRTLKGGTRILGLEESTQRLVNSASAAEPPPGGAFGLGRPHEVGRSIEGGGDTAATGSPLGVSADELNCFRDKLCSDLRLLVRLFRFFAAPSAAAQPSPTKAAAAAAAVVVPADAMLLPEMTELAVTIVLTRARLPQLLETLKLPSLPVGDLGTPLPAAATAGGYRPSCAVKGDTDGFRSFNLLMLAEPLQPSPAICYTLPFPQQHEQQQQQQQQHHQQQQQQQQRARESELDGSQKLQQQQPITTSRCSSSSSSSAVRWCNVLLLPHEGRQQPNVKRTDWVLQRQELLQEARRRAAELGAPVEEALLDKDGALLEGCSSNFFVYSKARGCVLTAPDSVCLPGATRRQAIKAFTANGLETVFETPQWRRKQEEQWTAAWISSASRLLLPIRSLIKPMPNTQQVQDQQQQPQQHKQQQQQRSTWISVDSPVGEDARVYWLDTEETKANDNPSPQHQQQQQQQPEGERLANKFEEFIFAVEPDSLAARAAQWTTEMAEAEAQPIF